MVTPDLTICVPTYERPALLARALSSVVDQTGLPSERVELLVSDNSPDASRAIAEDHLTRWSGPTCYLPNSPSIGPIPNFNQCLTRASGRFVLMLHDDDYLLPGSIDAILAAIDRAGDERVLLFGVDIVDENGGLRRRQAFRTEQRLGPRRALLRLLSDSSFVRIPAIVIRRDVFDEVGPFDETVGNPTDFELLTRIFARFGVTCETATIAAYSVHVHASTSEMFHADTIETVMTIFNRARALRVLPDDLVAKCEADWFHQFILGGAYRSLRAGDPDRARTILGLLSLPNVAVLGPSKRWRPLRWLFTAIVRLPPWLAARMMRTIGRASPERIWLSW
jgi:glycosyltransferase involved in cell wall biosynthesis